MQYQEFNKQQQPQLNIVKVGGASTSPYENIKFDSKIQQIIYKEIGNYTYNSNDILGIGEFSKVYKGIEKQNNNQVAIKVIDKKTLQNNSIFLNLLQNEISILSNIEMKSLLKLFDYQESSNNIYIITEYCEDGNLQQIIQKKGYIPEHNAVKILKHLIKGLLYLKEKKIIHRDIKSTNILVSNQIPKLADFGFAINQNLPPSGDILQVGTPLYMAPEIFYQYQYSTKTDLWALGIVFYEMLFGKVPFDAKNKTELDIMYKNQQKYQTIQFDNGPQKVTDQAQDFIKQILIIDPNQRYDIAQAANHPLIQQVHPHANKNVNQNLIQN